MIVRLRAIVAHPFRVIKRQFGNSKVCYRGLAKTSAQVLTLFALSNLWMVRRHLLLQTGSLRLEGGKLPLRHHLPWETHLDRKDFPCLLRISCLKPIIQTSLNNSLRRLRTHTNTMPHVAWMKGSGTALKQLRPIVTGSVASHGHAYL